MALKVVAEDACQIPSAFELFLLQDFTAFAPIRFLYLLAGALVAAQQQRNHLSAYAYPQCQREIWFSLTA